MERNDLVRTAEKLQQVDEKLVQEYEKNATFWLVWSIRRCLNDLIFLKWLGQTTWK